MLGMEEQKGPQTAARLTCSPPQRHLLLQIRSETDQRSDLLGLFLTQP